MLSKAQINEYHERGFIAVDRVLPDDQVDELRMITDDFVDRSRAADTRAVLREDMPFYPTDFLNWEAPGTSRISEFFGVMRPSLFKEVRTYAGVFKKYLHKFAFAQGRTAFEDRWN